MARLEGLVENQHLEGVSVFEAGIGRKIMKIQGKDVACFEREHNTGYIWLKDGSKYNMEYKLYELAKMIDPVLFFQINRSQMVCIQIIKGYEPIKNRQYLVLLKDEIILDIADLVVSRDRSDDFRTWYKGLNQDLVKSQ